MISDCHCFLFLTLVSFLSSYVQRFCLLFSKQSILNNQGQNCSKYRDLMRKTLKKSNAVLQGRDKQSKAHIRQLSVREEQGEDRIEQQIFSCNNNICPNVACEQRRKQFRLKKKSLLDLKIFIHNTCVVGLLACSNIHAYSMLIYNLASQLFSPCFCK